MRARPSPIRSVPGTVGLVAATLATAGAQACWGVSGIADAVGVAGPGIGLPSWLVRVGEGQVLPGGLTLVAYVFPHGGWWHVLPNMTALAILGAIAERRYGTRWLLAMYFLSGAVGALCYPWVVPTFAQPLAGASLAICGLGGAVAARRWLDQPHPPRRRRWAPAADAAAAVALGAWVILRDTPPQPDLQASILYHALPAFLMWLAVRYGARPEGR